MQYTAKVITIVNHTFTAVNTWEQIDLSSIVSPTSIRKFYFKARENDTIDTAFNYNFSSITPLTYATNGGQGVAFNNVSLPNIYVRATNINIVIEVVIFS